LESDEVEKIFQGKRQVLYGIDILRKICNHPCLLEVEGSSKLQVVPFSHLFEEIIISLSDFSQTLDAYQESGKLLVVKSLMELWKREGNRVLIFTQTRQMLNILEGFVKFLGTLSLASK
jgi:DNA excision repair protein ERCC-6